LLRTEAVRILAALRRFGAQPPSPMQVAPLWHNGLLFLAADGMESAEIPST